MRHPRWGVVQPAYFIPDERIRTFKACRTFVIGTAHRGLGTICLPHKGRSIFSINTGGLDSGMTDGARAMPPDAR